VFEPIAQRLEIVDGLPLAGDDRLPAMQEVAFSEQLLGERARRRLGDRLTCTWRPSAGQWNSNATCGFSATSRALRVHNADVKTSASASTRFSVTVRADGRPSAPAVTNATDAGCAWPARSASAIHARRSCSG
jgi:hypothetical protein